MTTTEQHCTREIEWYARHGHYVDRVVVSRSGLRYVIGDWSWNRQHPDRSEWIEAVMSTAIGRPEGTEP